MSIVSKLKELGLEIPVAAKPLAAYAPAVRVGNYVYTSGQLPVIAGKLQYVGKVGAEVAPEVAYEAAKLCAINCLAAVNTVADVEQIEKVVKVVAFVASAPDFHGQPGVANGASELMGKILAEAGVHARSAVGVAELPLNAPVEIEMIVKLKE